jgi:hypothetical protein
LSSNRAGHAWSRDKFELLECRKHHAASVFVTDAMVESHLEGHSEIRQKWSSEVVGSWFDDDEKCDQFLLRANRFLHEHVALSMGILQDVVQTSFDHLLSGVWN